MAHIKKIDEMYFGDKTSNAPYVFNDVERKKVKDIVSRMGKAETELRELLNDLKMSLPAGYESFEFDGDVITKECIEKWENVLANEIDKFCYFV